MGGRTFSFPLSSNFRSLRVYRKFSTSCMSPSPVAIVFSLSLFTDRIFYAHAKKTHAENVCTRTRSTRLPRWWRFLVAPLYPQLPQCVSPSASLFHDSIPSSPSFSLALFLSLFCTHARRCCLSSFFLSSHGDTPLFDAASIPAKTICQGTGRKCKASSTLFYYWMGFNVGSFASMPISILTNCKIIHHCVGLKVS